MQIANRIKDKRDNIFWDYLYKRYTPKLFKLCRNFCRGYATGEEIKDLVHSAWYEFIKDLDNFDIDSGVKSLLYEITRNTCRDFLRRKKRVRYTNLVGTEETRGELYDIDIADNAAIWDYYKT